LLVSTPRQIYLQSSLHLPAPHYAHLPLLTNRHGQKWSKQTRAEPLDMHRREALLRQVLHYLGLPDAPDVDKPRDLLAWAAQHWRIDRVPPEAVCTEIE
jgi:glutamyl-Q tRNA(asp) synthetase